MVPVSRLFPRLSCRREVRRRRVLGIVPVNLLLSRERADIRRILPKVLGMVPTNEFPPRFRWCPFKIFKLSGVSGICPSRRLLFSDSPYSPCRLSERSRLRFKLRGIDPVSWLLSRYKYFILRMSKKLCGMLPKILLLLTEN